LNGERTRKKKTCESITTNKPATEKGNIATKREKREAREIKKHLLERKINVRKNTKQDIKWGKVGRKGKKY